MNVFIGNRIMESQVNSNSQFLDQMHFSFRSSREIILHMWEVPFSNLSEAGHIIMNQCPPPQVQLQQDQNSKKK